MSEEDTDSDATTCDTNWSTELANEAGDSHDVGLSQPRATGFLHLKQTDASNSCAGYRYSERPKFPYTAGCKKIDFVLSSSEVSPPVKVPASINQYLRTYQRDGVQFLYNQFKKNCGSVLCDESGLGKKVQVIAFLSAVLGRVGPGDKANASMTHHQVYKDKLSCTGAALIVCPASVIDCWVSELETWSHLSHAIYTGANAKSASDADTLGRGVRMNEKAPDVVLVAYDTAVAHMGDLNSVGWLAVVCDDLISGDCDVQMTVFLDSLKVKRRIALFNPTIEIRFTELWSLFKWMNPSGLGTLQCFQSAFEQSISGQRNLCGHDERETSRGRGKLAELKEVVESCVLGRARATLSSQLPTRGDYTVLCPPSELQGSIYQSIVECDDVQLILSSGEACDCYSGNDRGECCYKRNSEGISWNSLVVEYMTLLTKCANHVGLLLPATSSSRRHGDKTARICCDIFSKHSQFLATTHDASFLTLSDPLYCGKMQAVEKLLSKFKGEHAKVVLYCNSVQLLNVLEDFLVCKGYMYCRLDGINNKAYDTLKAFNSDPDLFAILISRKCEGMSLNITGASRVIIFDPNYDLLAQVQSEERFFKLGRSRDVIVYRLLAEGTIEEALYIRENHKECVWKPRQYNISDVDHVKNQRYFNTSPRSGKKTSDFANIFLFRKSNLHTTVDCLSEAKHLNLMEGSLKLIHESVIDTNTSSGAHMPFRGASDFVSYCVKIALEANNLVPIGTADHPSSTDDHSHQQYIKGNNKCSDLGYCSAGSREVLAVPLEATCKLDSGMSASTAEGEASIASTKAYRSAPFTKTIIPVSSDESSRGKEFLDTGHNSSTTEHNGTGSGCGSTGLSEPDSLILENASKSKKPVPYSSHRCSTTRIEKEQLPYTDDNTLDLDSQLVMSSTHSPVASSPVIGPLSRHALEPKHFPVLSEAVEALCDDSSVVCDEQSTQGTVSTFLPSPHSLLSQGSLASPAEQERLDLSPSPGILQPRLACRFITAAEKSPPGLFKALYGSSPLIDELLQSSETSSPSCASTAAEFSEDPPSSKRKFDGSYRIEEPSPFCGATTTCTLPRSDIDVLFEL